MLDSAALAQMRAFKQPFESLHGYAFYALLVMIVLHIAGVVFSEVRGGGSLVSAMFTGRKILRDVPVDHAGIDSQPDDAAAPRAATD